MEKTGMDHHQAFPVMVLAAGRSRRMGQAKALLPLDGGTLLDHAIGQARHLGGPVTVVAGGWYPLIRYRCRRQPSAWLFNRDWREGMSASLKVGVASLGASARGVFVMLLDQPLIRPDRLMVLADAARRNPSQSFAADMLGKPGAPAYIPRRLWPQVIRLEGDRGAAAILARDCATRIIMDGASADVDTLRDWRSVSRQLAEQP